jgi:hypothetical protein
MCVCMCISSVELQFDRLRNFRPKESGFSYNRTTVVLFWEVLLSVRVGDAVDVSRARTAGFSRLDRAEVPVEWGVVEFGNLTTLDWNGRSRLR